MEGGFTGEKWINDLSFQNLSNAKLKNILDC